MKRYTTPVLEIKIDIERNLISTVRFMFKQENDENCTTQLIKTFPSSSVTYDTDSKCFLVSWTRDETRIFAPNEVFYLDTEVTLYTGKIPDTQIVKLFMAPTLFKPDPTPNSND